MGVWGYQGVMRGMGGGTIAKLTGDADRQTAALVCADSVRHGHNSHGEDQSRLEMYQLSD